ncbi:hypothetical protein G6F22_018048 [Rhizopus arrhizus]|nr:hypothetical protein G6F22_018048 [Rhizopus arrhizus]
MLCRTLGAPGLLEACSQLVDRGTCRLVLPFQPIEHVAHDVVHLHECGFSSSTSKPQHVRVQEAARAPLEEVDLDVGPLGTPLPCDGERGARRCRAGLQRHRYRTNKESVDRGDKLGGATRTTICLPGVGIQLQPIARSRKRYEEQALFFLVVAGLHRLDAGQSLRTMDQTVRRKTTRRHVVAR